MANNIVPQNLETGETGQEKVEAWRDELFKLETLLALVARFLDGYENSKEIEGCHEVVESVRSSIAKISSEMDRAAVE